MLSLIRGPHPPKSCVFDEERKSRLEPVERLLENSLTLLTDQRTYIIEAVKVEGSAASIYTILDDERGEAVDRLRDKIREAVGTTEHKTALMLQEFVFPSSVLEGMYIQVSDGISKPFLIPMLNEYIQVPPRWTKVDSLTNDTTDDLTAHNPTPETAIVCITEDEFKALPDEVRTHVARALNAAQKNPKDNILKRLKETCETLRQIAPSEPAPGDVTRQDRAAEEAAGTKEPPARDAGEPVETKPKKRRRWPADFTDIPGKKPLTDEHKELFCKTVLKHIGKIGHDTAPADKWKPADTLGYLHPETREMALVDYKGATYRIYYVPKRYQYNKFFVVRLEYRAPGEARYPRFFCFIG